MFDAAGVGRKIEEKFSQGWRTSCLPLYNTGLDRVSLGGRGALDVGYGWRGNRGLRGGDEMQRGVILQHRRENRRKISEKIAPKLRTNTSL